MDIDFLPMDAQLIAGWLRARSVARGPPLPVANHGGWRVDTGLPHELRRYVFARAGDGLRALANDIAEPGVFLKLCGSEEAVRALLPPRWQLQEPRYVMTGDAFHAAELPLARGYSLQLTRAGVVTSARIVSAGGELAASGYAAETGGCFIYDQIETAAGHRRRGLASRLMQALRAARQCEAATQVLVSTAAGQALYASLGWTTRSPYTTAAIPAAF